MAWAPDYATTAELAALVRIQDTLDDVQLGLAITTASRAIDGPAGCNRQFGQVASPEARFYAGRWDPEGSRWVVETDDLMTVTGLAVAIDDAADGTYSTTLDTVYTGWRPSNAGAKGRPWTSMSVLPSSGVQPGRRADSVRITARWGWTSVPTTIKQACLLQASRILARRDAPFGVAGSPDAGSEVRLLARLDPDVAVAIAPYRRWWGAV